MHEPIEEAYFVWLCTKVLPLNTQNYQKLMQVLYCTEFVWIVPGDRNRTEDGLELRQYFLDQAGWENDPTWWNEPCSLLEFFIAFSDRAKFTTEKPLRDWFWTFMDNLSLDDYRQIGSIELPVVEDILYTFVWRQYDELGRGGGMCPLSTSQHDQREVEIWYQFNEYIVDQGLL